MIARISAWLRGQKDEIPLYTDAELAHRECMRAVARMPDDSDEREYHESLSANWEQLLSVLSRLS